MKPSDRRSSRRYYLRVPLRIRALKSDEPEKVAESANISEQGVYFLTDSPFGRGAAVQVVVNMPLEVTGEPSCDWMCIGHVAHASEVTTGQSSFGVGVRFDYFEILGPAEPSVPPSLSDRSVGAGHSDKGV